MSEWIETKVSFDKTMSNGFNKRVTELYLVNALSFTEAEANITKEMQCFISGEFSVSAVKKSNISEIFFVEDGDRWYKVKVAYIEANEKNGEEKRVGQYILVQAKDFIGAYNNFMDGMKQSMADFEIESIVETKIMDVYDYNMGE